MGLWMMLAITGPACETGIDPMNPGGPPPDSTNPDSGNPPADAPTLPPAPLRLRLVREVGFAKFSLRWTLPDTTTEIDSIVLYASDREIDKPDESLVLAELDGDATSFKISIQPNSGEHHFRVAARDANGSESDLSDEFAADATQRLVFSASKHRADTREMFVSFPGDIEPTTVSGELRPFSMVGAPLWAPDGRKFAFISDRDRVGSPALYVNDAGGEEEPVRISEIGEIGSSLGNTIWTSDATRVIYTFVNAAQDETKSFIAKASGEADPVEIGAALSQASLCIVSDYLSETHQVVMASLDGTSFEVVAIHIVDLESAETRELVRFEPTELRDAFPSVSPDETRFAFISDRQTPGVRELFVVPLDGSEAPRAISGPIVADGGVTSAQWSPDGQSIAFTAKKDDAEIAELYVVDADGASLPDLASGARPKRFGVRSFEWSPDGTRIGFLADKEVSTRDELYVATVAVGGEPALASGVPVGRGLRALTWSPRSNQLAFIAEIDATNVNKVYSTRVDGIGQPHLESGAMVMGGSVSLVDFNYSTDGNFLCFRADKDVDDVFDRYIGRVLSGVEPVSVIGDMTPGGAAGFGTASWSTLGD